jgi:hypothetical protein
MYEVQSISNQDKEIKSSEENKIAEFGFFLLNFIFLDK